MTISDAVMTQIRENGIDSQTGLPVLPEGYSWRIRKPNMFLLQVGYSLQLLRGSRIINEKGISSRTAEFRYTSDVTHEAKQILTVSTESYARSTAEQRAGSKARIKAVRNQRGPLFTRHQLSTTDEQLGAFLSAFHQNAPLEVPALPEGIRFVVGKTFRLGGDSYISRDMELGKAKISLARVRQVPLLGGLLWMTVGYDILSTTLFTRATAGHAMDFRSLLFRLFSCVDVEQPGAGLTALEVREAKRQAAARQFA